jgi:hypothetical protein
MTSLSNVGLIREIVSASIRAFAGNFFNCAAGLRWGASGEELLVWTKQKRIEVTIIGKSAARRWRSGCAQRPIELLRARESHPNKITMKSFLKTASRRYGLQVGLLLSFLLLPVSNLHALIFTTNCPDLNPSLPQPKRIRSGCDRFGPLYVLNVNQFASGSGLRYFGAAYNYNPSTGANQLFYLGGTMNSDGTFASQFAMTNGYLFILPSGRFAALQNLTSVTGTVTAFGVYTVTGAALTPVFEIQLPLIDPSRVNIGEMSDGMMVMSLNNKTNSVTLLGLAANGGLMWARQLTSAEFPSIVPASPGDQTHYVQMSPIGAANILLYVSATERVGTTNTAKAVVVRLGTDGAVQSAQKIGIPLLNTNQNAFAAFPVVTAAGEVLIYATDYNYADFTPSTILAKFDANGAFLWGRRFAGGSISSGPQPIDSQGSTLLSLMPPSSTGGSHAVCCILDATGQVTSLAQVDTPGNGSISASSFSTAAGKIYFAGSFTTNGSAIRDTGIIGSSSLTLTNFVARKYVKKPVITANLFRLQDERLAFSASDNSGTVDLVFLNSNLIEQANCQLFEPDSFVITTPSISVLPITPTVADVSVQSSNITLNLSPTQLSLERMVFAEADLCTICSYSLSSTNATLVASGSSTNVSVTVQGPANCAWTVVNPCPDWLTVSPTNGTGSGQVTLSASASAGGSRNCTLMIADLSFTVTQSADILALAAALDATNLPWTTGGNADWSGQTLVTHDGVDAGQSGAITNSQETWMETTVVGPGTLTFWWKVSSEAGSDRLRFLINGSSQNNISGEVNWQQKTNSIAAGTNVLRWRYTKDVANSSGQDRGWVDQVVWLPSNTCTFSLSASNASLGASGGSTNVNVTAVSGSNCGWTVNNPCPNWITVSPANGTGNGQVTITVSANNTGSSRNCTLTVAGELLNIMQGAAGTPANLLLQYNPTGPQSTATPIAPSFAAPNISASTLEQVGLEAWMNTDVFPVGRITTSSNIDLTQYLAFTVGIDSGKTINFQSLLYDKQSYAGAGPTHASIRSSLDSFAVDIETLVVNPAGFESLNFDMSTLSAMSGPVSFRIYFYGAPSFSDWADLVSTGLGGSGLRLNGIVNSGPLAIQVGDAEFGFSGGHFGFNITGSQGQTVVIEFSTNLQAWTPIQTNVFGAGPVLFSDPQSGFSGARFYRGRLQ